MIGSLGEVVFEVSSDLVRTLDGLRVQYNAKYAQHDIHGRKGLLEFTGLDPTKINFRVRLDAALGVNPKEELAELKDILEAGRAVPFVLDGEPQGWHLWVLEHLNVEQRILNNTGALILAEVTLNLKEYAEGGEEVGV